LDRVVKIALRTLLREVAEVPLKPELLLLIAGARVVAARLRRPLVHDDRAHLLLSRPPAWPPCSLLLLGHFALSATFFFATWSTAFFAPKRPTPAAMTAPAIFIQASGSAGFVTRLGIASTAPPKGVWPVNGSGVVIAWRRPSKPPQPATTSAPSET